MKKIIIAFIVLVIIAVGTYYLVFKDNSTQSPANVSPTNVQIETPPVSQDAITPDAQAPVASNVTVNIKDFAFNPPTLTIKAGTKVTWVNNDSVNHTVTSDSGDLLDSDTILPGQSFSFTFKDIGTTNYHCSIHTMMKGAVVVTE